MKARRLVSAVALAALICVAAPAAFAGDTQQPWDMPGSGSCSLSLLDAAMVGVDAALTVL